MAILPVSNVIDVTITNTPSGLTEKNVNSLALFTTESPDNIDPYDVYVSASQVAADYGTASVTAAMANAIFAQTPNILTGGGRLVIIPLQGSVSATAGHADTTSLSTNLTAILAVTSGDLKVTIDSHVHNLTGINFAGAANLQDVATILQSKLLDVTIVPNGATLKMTSKKVGSSSTVTFGAVSAGSGTDLSGAGYFDAGDAVFTGGTNSTGETILAAIARTQGLVGYVPVITNLNIEDTAVMVIASGIQAMDNMFLHHFSSSEDFAGIVQTIKAASDTKTRPLVYTTGQSDANLMKSAYAGGGFSTDFSGSNTTSTRNLKPLATIDPDPGITQTLYESALTNGADIYVSYDGVPSILSTGANDYFDDVYADLALKFALETAGFDFLRQTSTKVPQTEQGMNGLKSAYSGVLQQFVVNGSIAPGAWTSSDTFGDPQIFKNNIVTRGYYIFSTPVALQNQSDRQARKAPLVQIAIKRAGAIQTSDVLVIVNN